MRKNIRKAVIFFSVIFFLTACEKEGDLIYLSGQEANKLVATESKVVLTQETANQVVLSLTWTKSDLSVSDPSMYAPDVESVYIQIAASDDFSGTVTEARNTELSRAYVGSELNTIAKNLGLKPDVSSPLYFRIRSNLGANMESLYSSVIKVDVTAYEIDMTVGFILEANQSESPYSLLSPSSNGVYTGFIGAASWYNFWLREGDGVIWGNYPVDGQPFKLGSSEDQTAPWNCWFPSPGGCYYVTFDTNIREWSTIYIPSLTISGGLQTEMTFDRKLMQWKVIFNSAAAGTITIRLSGTGKLYNYSTGTDDAAAIDAPVAFGGNADALSFGNTAGDIAVNVPGTGDFTLIVDLNNPEKWTVSVESGGKEPEPVYPQLYLSGIDDGISGGWNFDNFISLYDEENKNYVGFTNVNSLWGYKMFIEKDNWGDFYTTAEGDAYSGKLVFQGGDNIPAPEPGLYLIEASLTGMTYSLSKVGSQIWIMGMDENYQFDTPLNATETPGVYSGAITVVNDSPWGLEIQLDDSWSHKFGGYGGTLYYKGDNINDDIVHHPGTYTVTVDLIHMTYSIMEN